MSNTIEDLEKQLGTGTLNPEVEQFVREYIASKEGKSAPGKFANELSNLMDEFLSKSLFRFDSPYLKRTFNPSLLTARFERSE